jgi:peptidoglycan/xylan/chitin deacetylase (PgdA/CDA1 family)
MKGFAGKIKKWGVVAGIVLSASCFSYGCAKPSPPVSEVQYMKQVPSSEEDFQCEIQIPIVMYHNIDGDSDYSITSPQFIKQMDYLKEQGYQTLTLDEIIAFREGKEFPTSEKVIALTFDDGYNSLYHIAYPELKKRGFHAIAFVSPIKSEITSSEMKSMSDSGVINIGSHLMTHNTATELYTDEEMRTEMRESKQILEEIVDKPISAMAWPGGIRRDGSIDKDLAKEEGYTAVFEAWGGKSFFDDGSYDIPRLDSHWYPTFEMFKEMLEKDRAY